jgi:energy-coupling factor transporter transmembrane protein EcfT
LSAISPISFYFPKATLLHQLHIVVKLIIFSFYTIMIFSIDNPIVTLSFYILLVGLFIVIGLPLRNKIFVGGSLLLLLLVVLSSSQETVIGHFILTLGKVACLFFVIALFTMTTRLNSILQLLVPRNKKLYIFSQLIYVINTTLAVAPSIQYDLQRAIDSETIRRGKKIGFFSFDSWVTIFSITLVRTLNRTERFTDTVIDRGFVPTEGIKTLSEHPINKKDVILTFFMISPGVIIWILAM